MRFHVARIIASPEGLAARSLGTIVFGNLGKLRFLVGSEMDFHTTSG